MPVQLRELTGDDLPLVARWLQAEAVRRTWGDPEANLRGLRMPPARGSGRAIVECAGRAVGLVLWQHPTREELDMAGLADIPASAVDIDILIGEPAAQGRGLGTAAIDLVARRTLCDPAVPFVMACVAPDNPASLRAFAKAGFRQDRAFDDVPQGVHLLLLRRRGQEPAA